MSIGELARASARAGAKQRIGWQQQGRKGREEKRELNKGEE